VSAERDRQLLPRRQPVSSVLLVLLLLFLQE
jgi:hypothetical protein